MTVSSYHERALASTDSSFECGETAPFSAGPRAGLASGSALRSSLFSGPLIVRCCRALATYAGPGGYPPFGHSVRALTCESLRHTCRWGRSQGCVTRLWSAILPPALGALPVEAWWRFATWPVAGCLVGSGPIALWRSDWQEGVAMKKSRE